MFKLSNKTNQNNNMNCWMNVRFGFVDKKEAC